MAKRKWRGWQHETPGRRLLFIVGWLVLFSGIPVVLVVDADAINQSNALVDLLGGLIALGGLGILLFLGVLRRD